MSGNGWGRGGGSLSWKGYAFYTLTSPAGLDAYAHLKRQVGDRNKPLTSLVSVSLRNNGEVNLKITYKQTVKTVRVPASVDLTEFVIGYMTFEDGYNRINMQISSVTPNKAVKGLVSSIIFDKVDQAVQPSFSPSYYIYGRRGPNGYLNYVMPVKNFEYFYNELYVPKGYSNEGAFFMAIGFYGGYFGMQHNGPENKCILMSIWSGYKVERVGPGVSRKSFSEDGTGSSGRINFNWKEDTTYKFLLKVQGNLTDKSTLYTAWYQDPNDDVTTNGKNQGWKLLVAVRKGGYRTSLTSTHSFLESFKPNRGNSVKMSYYKNQHVYANNKWIPVNKAVYKGPYFYGRRDIEGGYTPDKTGFYMKTNGFFDNQNPTSAVLIRNQGPKVDVSIPDLP